MSDRLTKSSYLIARNMPTVIERYCLQSDSLFHTLKALKINQCVSQASWNDKPLLQLPHFTNEMVDVCNKKHGIFYPADIFMLGKDSSSKLFDTLGLTPEQVRDVFQVENSVFAVKPKVTYDLPSTVGCSSDVTLEITVSAVGIGVNTDSCSPDFHCEPYFDKEETEGRNRCCLGKKLKKNLSNASEFGLDECPSESRFSHTPYIMEQNYEKWWFVLGDEESNILLAIEQGKIQRSPDGGDDDDDDESEDDETVKVFIKFKTPAKPGIYNFTLYVVCGTYIGRDVKLNVPVTVDQITLDSFD